MLTMLQLNQINLIKCALIQRDLRAVALLVVGRDVSVSHKTTLQIINTKGVTDYHHISHRIVIVPQLGVVTLVEEEMML